MPVRLTPSSLTASSHHRASWRCCTCLHLLKCTQVSIKRNCCRVCWQIFLDFFSRSRPAFVCIGDVIHPLSFLEVYNLYGVAVVVAKPHKMRPPPPLFFLLSPMFFPPIQHTFFVRMLSDMSATITMTITKATGTQGVG